MCIKSIYITKNLKANLKMPLLLLPAEKGVYYLKHTLSDSSCEHFAVSSSSCWLGNQATFAFNGLQYWQTSPSLERGVVVMKHWYIGIKAIQGDTFVYSPVMMLSRSVVGIQKIPTRRSLTARLRMNRLVTVRMFLLRSTRKHTTPFPTMHTRKIRR